MVVEAEWLDGLLGELRRTDSGSDPGVSLFIRVR